MDLSKRGEDEWLKTSIAIVAMLIILTPFAYSHHHPLVKGVMADKHCQGCLSVLAAIFILTTVLMLATPAQSPFRLLPVEKTATHFAGVAAMDRAPPLASCR